MKTTDRFYYGHDGGAAQGPLPLGQIRRMVDAGEIPSAGLAIAPQSSGPWQLYGVVMAAMAPAPAPKPTPEKERAAKAAPKAAPKAGQPAWRKTFSVGGFIEALGVVALAGALFNFLAALWLVFVQGDPSVATNLMAACYLGGMGLGLVVTGEVARRLRDIAEDVEDLTEHLESAARDLRRLAERKETD